MGNAGDTSLGGERKSFPSTLLDVLDRVREGPEGMRREAFGLVCARYWKPVYLYTRMVWAKSNEDAKDATQSFFAWLLEKDVLTEYRRSHASFRAFLKTVLRRFLQNEERDSGRLKRGGALKIVSLEDAAARGTLSDPPAGDPEAAFDRAWKFSVVERAVERVREHLRTDPNVIKFEVYRQYDLVPRAERPSYRDLAHRAGIKETDVVNYLRAVRELVRSEVRSELGETAPDGADGEAEWNGFFQR